jgi:hypothetical protein
MDSPTMKTIHQIAKAAYGAYLKALTRQGVSEIEQPNFGDGWDQIPLRQQIAFIEGIKHALAEAAVAPIETINTTVSADSIASDAEGGAQ